MTNLSYNKLSFVNLRLDRNGNLSNAKPCESCQSLLDFIQPHVLYYSDEEGKMVKY